MILVLRSSAFYAIYLGAIFFVSDNTQCAEIQEFIPKDLLNHCVTTSRASANGAVISSHILSSKNDNCACHGPLVYLIETDQCEGFVLRVFPQSLTFFERKRQTDIAIWAGKKELGPAVLFHDKHYKYFAEKYFKSSALKTYELCKGKTFTKAVKLIRKLHCHEVTTYGNDLIIAQTFAKVNLVEEWGLMQMPRVFSQAAWYARILIDIFLNDPHDKVPCHNDLHAGNFLLNDKNLIFIDWEYSCMSNKFIELAVFSFYMKLDVSQDNLLLGIYCLENISHRDRFLFLLAKCIFLFFDAVYFLTYPYVHNQDFQNSRAFLPANGLGRDFLDFYYAHSSLSSKEWEKQHIKREDIVEERPRAKYQEMGVLCLREFFLVMDSSSFSFLLKNSLTKRTICKNLRLELLLNKNALLGIVKIPLSSLCITLGNHNEIFCLK